MPKGFPGRPQCVVDGCDNPNDARGMCRLHYQRVMRGADPTHNPKKDREQAFRDSYVVSESGCWEWQRAKVTGGYAAFWDGRSVTGHRWSYMQFVGPIPDGLHIDHLCRNRACVNPDHLEAVPIAVNVLRGEGLSAQNARKTHCKRGHEFTPDNTVIGTKGERACRTCRNANARERARRAKSA